MIKHPLPKQGGVYRRDGGKLVDASKPQAKPPAPTRHDKPGHKHEDKK